METRIRFVGGPWHNRLESVELTEKLGLTPPTGVACGIQTIFKCEVYRLVRFTTDFGTHYLQYVHSSLINGQRVHCCASHERLPKVRFGKRERLRLESKLRSIMG